MKNEDLSRIQTTKMTLQYVQAHRQIEFINKFQHCSKVLNRNKTTLKDISVTEREYRTMLDKILYEIFKKIIECILAYHRLLSSSMKVKLGIYIIYLLVKRLAF